MIIQSLLTKDVTRPDERLNENGFSAHQNNVNANGVGFKRAARLPREHYRPSHLPAYPHLAGYMGDTHVSLSATPLTKPYVGARNGHPCKAYWVLRQPNRVTFHADGAEGRGTRYWKFESKAILSFSKFYKATVVIASRSKSIG